MKGRQHIEIRNNRSVFKFDLDHNISVIKGDSATGKTTLVDMIAEFEQYGADSGISLSSDKRFNIIETSFSKEAITNKTIYDFFDFDQTEDKTYQICGVDVSLEELYSAVRSDAENTVSYYTETKKIPLTDKNTKETDGCYGKLDSSQKLKALADSWNAYSLRSADKAPEVFVNMEKLVSSFVKKYEALSSNSWKKEYAVIIKSRAANATTAYQLIKLDTDAVPELLIDESTVAGQFPIYSYSSGKIVTPDVDYTLYRDVEYIEGAGLIKISDYVGSASENVKIFEYKNGRFDLLAEGSDFMNRIDYTEVYTWNGNTVTEEKYKSEMAKAFDPDKATKTSDRISYSKEDILNMIADY